jgi:hypothetical protein
MPTRSRNGSRRRRRARAGAASRAGRTAARTASSRRGAPRGRRSALSALDARRQRNPGRGTAAERRAAQRVGELAGRRRLAGSGDERAVDEAQEPLRQVGPELPSGRAPASIARAVSSIEPRQNGCRPASASQSITPTAQTSAAGVASPPASRSGEMYASVPGHVSLPRSASRRRPSARARSPGHAPRRGRRQVRRTVRRLDVAVQDPGRVRMREAVADLRDRPRWPRRRQLSRRAALAVRLARDELVRDVDVPRVAATRRRAGRRDGAGARPALASRSARMPTCPLARRS